MSDDRVTGIETRIGAVENRLGVVETKIDSLRAEMTGMGGKLTDLRREMRVLHEETLDNIKALAPDFRPIRREFKKADAELREEFDRRLSPVEAAIRKRSRN